MNLSAAIGTAIPSAHGPVLQELVNLDRAATAAEISGRVAGKVGKSRVYEVLSELLENGLVASRNVGSTKLFFLNNKHLAYEAVLSLAQLRQTFITRLIDQFLEWQPRPAEAHLFGSVAEGMSTSQSDVDVLLVRPDEIRADNKDWERQVLDLEMKIQDWTGNHAEIVEHSFSQWRALKDEKFNLAANVLEQGLRLYPKTGLDS